MCDFISECLLFMLKDDPLFTKLTLYLFSWFIKHYCNKNINKFFISFSGPIIQSPQLMPKPAKTEALPIPTTDNGAESDSKEPEMKVTTILKRPASTPSNLALNGQDDPDDLDPIINLRKREEEYEKMRLRILGSTGNDEENNTENSS